LLFAITATGCFLCTTVDAQQIVEQPDPCKTKSRVVGDAEYLIATGNVKIKNRFCMIAQMG